MRQGLHVPIIPPVRTLGHAIGVFDPCKPGNRIVPVSGLWRYEAVFTVPAEPATVLDRFHSRDHP